MKKLMIAAAIVCAAAYANAASFNWFISVAGDKQLPVYICQAGATGFESVADIQTYLIGTSGNFGTMAYDDWEDASFVGTFVGGIDGEAGTMQDFTYVIVNADNTGYWTAAGSAELYTTGATHQDSNINVTELLATPATAWSTGPGPEPVPEPTSAMLLLLGVAGLALRRRRA